ncbi:MAG: hypothetical protein HYV32_03830 [Candidatus Kerfeldbacteria bacterium]|nr:hypothetical protein [Candidatus Kerfeldbacteria bacterium]
MNKPHKNIEELLQQSRRIPRVLSSQKKQDLWLRIQEQHSAPTIEHLAAEPKPWWKRFWLLIGIPAVALAVVIFIVSVRYETPAQEHIAQQTNTNTENTNNTNTQIDEVPTPIANAGRTEARMIIDELLVDGRGGGPDDTDYASWTFSYSKTLSTDQFVATEYTVEPLSEKQMRDIAEAFTISDQLTAVTTLGWDSYLTTVPKQQTAGCRGARHWQQNVPLTTPRCLFINSRGLVDLEQTETAAQADPLKEATNDIHQITGIPEAAFIIEPVVLETDSYAQTTIFDQYYTIYLPVEEKTTIPFYPYAWHAALKNGKLVSLYGQLFVSEPSVQQYDIISQEEVYDRMVQDFSHMTGEEENAFDWVFVPPDHRVLSDMGIDTSNKKIDIEAINLQYEVLVHEVEKGVDDIRLIPLYRIQGKEHGTENTFELYIDATRDGNLYATYSLFNILYY